MNKVLCGLLGVSLLWFGGSYYGSTTAPVTLAGAIIKSKHSDDTTTKYKRKDCPVCKGKGWYMSGDGIKKIECNYCEPEKGSSIQAPPAPSKQNCPDGVCPINKPKGK
jgi:hypothetical protein